MPLNEPWFQSHAGSIEAPPSPLPTPTRAPFQSHAGSIEASVLIQAVITLILGFNPTLVRLRHGLCRFESINKIGFQSHAGSIEAAKTQRFIEVDLVFQSHAGSIEASAATCLRPGYG